MRGHVITRALVTTGVIALCGVTTGQAAAQTAPPRTIARPAQPPASPGPDGAAPAATAPAADHDYRVGAGDLLAIDILQAPELKSAARVSPAGAISVPLVGQVPVLGLTTHQIELALVERLEKGYIRNPQVTVQVTEMESHPVSVVGAVGAPGVFQIRSPMPLLNVLSLAQGVGEDAGDTIVVVRGSESKSIDLKTLMESADAEANVLVYPGDTLKVQAAPMIYVVGEVQRPGAFPLRGRDELTVMRALALGEGMTPAADRDDAVILRRREGGGHVEIPVKLDRIMRTEDPDVALRPQDVLFIQRNGGRVAASTVLEIVSRMFRPF